MSHLADIGINVIQISGIGPIPAEKVAYLVEKYNMDVSEYDLNSFKSFNDFLL